MKDRPAALAVGLVALLSISVPLTGNAIDVSVSAVVPSPEPPESPPTAINFQGLAYPGSDITFRQNGTFLATVPADPLGAFDVTITMDPGTYTFTIFGSDADGREGPTFSMSFTLTAGVTVNVTGIFLGPTIEASDDSFEIGDTITILGVTVPNSDVDLFVSSDEDLTFPVTADGDGLWLTQLVAGTDIETTGAHEARSKATSPDDSISEFSKTVAFAIEDGDSCSSVTSGDINCDGTVDLVDFSILLFYWQQTDPANERADINGDTIVDIIDFSIMLFYWTG